MGIESKSSQRFYYIDNVKAIAMLLVMLGHCALLNFYPGLYRWISSFHVPVFFVASGMLLASKKERTQTVDYIVKKKLYSYLIPFYVFSIINAIVVGILKIFSNRSDGVDFLKDAALNILLLNGRGANWFLPCLLIAELIFIFELKYFKTQWIIVINLILSILAVYFPHEMTIVWVVLRSFLGLACFSVGYYVYGILSRINKYREVTVMILMTLVHLIAFAINGDIAIHGINTGNSKVLFYVEILAGAIVAIMICRLLLERRIIFLSWLGSNTIIILTTHQTLIEIIWAVDGHFLDLLHKSEAALPFILFITITIIEIPIILFCNKYLYFFFGKKKTWCK